MRTRAFTWTTWITCLGWIFFASSVVAAETDATSPNPQAEIPTPLEATPSEPPAASEAEAQPEAAAGGLEPFRCACDCLCPSGGYSEPVFFELPPWTNRLCETFDGERCSVKLDTCNQPRIYQNCQTL